MGLADAVCRLLRLKRPDEARHERSDEAIAGADEQLAASAQGNERARRVIADARRADAVAARRR